jgi:hypothetical protein
MRKIDVYKKTNPGSVVSSKRLRWPISNLRTA